MRRCVGGRHASTLRALSVQGVHYAAASSIGATALAASHSTAVRRRTLQQPLSHPHPPLCRTARCLSTATHTCAAGAQADVYTRAQDGGPDDEGEEEGGLADIARQQQEQRNQHLLSLLKSRDYAEIITCYERDLSSLASLPLSVLRPAFLCYLTSLSHVDPPRAQSAFASWVGTRGLTPRDRDMYDTLLIMYAREGAAEEDLDRAMGILKRLKEADVRVEFKIMSTYPLMQRLLASGDVVRASWVYLHYRPTALFPNHFESLFRSFAHYDALGVCVDLIADARRLGQVPEQAVRGWMTTTLRDGLHSLLRHHRGTHRDTRRWHDRLLDSDTRLKDAEFLEAEMEALPSSGATNSDASAQSAAAASAALSIGQSHLPMLHQLVHSGQATLSAFERAFKSLATSEPTEVHAQWAVDIWHVLEGAQPEGQPSISRPDHTVAADDSNGDQGAALLSAHLASSPLAPTQSLYNLALQTICQSGPLTTRRHAALALGIFRRMVQLGVHRTMLTYMRLTKALSGHGNPLSSGLDAVMRQYQADATAVQLPPSPPHAAPHPESTTFHVSISAYESVLYAELRWRPAALDLFHTSARVRAYLNAMARQKMVWTESVYKDVLLLNYYNRDAHGIQWIVRRMEEEGYPVRSPMAMRLLEVCAGRWDPTLPHSRLSPHDMELVMQQVTFSHDVWSKAIDAHMLAPAANAARVPELRILALARACAASRLRSVDGVPPSPDVHPMLLHLHLVSAFTWSQQQQLVLSKHIYALVFCALLDLQTALIAFQQMQGARVTKLADWLGTETLTQSMADKAKQLDFPQLHAQLLQSMQQAGLVPSPQMLVHSFCVRAAGMDSSADALDTASGLVDQLDWFLRLTRECASFSTQALVDEQRALVRQESTLQALFDKVRLLPLDAAISDGLTPIVSDSPVADSLRSFKQLVQSSAVTAELLSTADTLAALQATPPDERRRHVSEMHASNRLRLSEQEATLIADDSEEQGMAAADEAAGASSPRLLRAAFSSAAIDAPSPFADVESNSICSLPVSPPPVAARLLALTSLRQMLSAVLSREVATRPAAAPGRSSPKRASPVRRSADLDMAFTLLIESIWEGARIMHVQRELLAGAVGLALCQSVLHLLPTHASSLLHRFTHTLRPSHFKSDSPVRHSLLNLLVDNVKLLASGHHPLDQLDGVLTFAERVTGTDSPLHSNATFFRSVYVAYGAHRQASKCMLHFHRAMMRMQSSTDATFVRQTRSVLLRSSPELVESLDRNHDVSGLQEVFHACEMMWQQDVAESLKPAKTASWQPPLVSSSLRGLVRLSAFSHASAENGYRVTRKGNGTLAPAVGMLSSSPLVARVLPDMPTELMLLLQYTLSADDESGANTVLAFITAHAPQIQAKLAAAGDAHVTADSLQLLLHTRASSGWPEVQSAWLLRSDAPYPAFHFSVPAGEVVGGVIDSNSSVATSPDAAAAAAAAAGDGVSSVLSDLRVRRRAVLDDERRVANDQGGVFTHIRAALRAPTPLVSCVAWEQRRALDQATRAATCTLASRALAMSSQTPA